MSLGVNLCFRLAGLAAKALGDSYDIDIMEAHHRGKIDAPSGTALKFGTVISENRDDILLDNAVYERAGPKMLGKIIVLDFKLYELGIRLEIIQFFLLAREKVLKLPTELVAVPLLLQGL